MEQVTIGTKNQIVIPRRIRAQITGLKPGRKVKIYSQDKQTVIIKLDRQSWLESSYGLMKEAWSKINPSKEIDQSRDQW